MNPELSDRANFQSILTHLRDIEGLDINPSSPTLLRIVEAAVAAGYSEGWRDSREFYEEPCA